MIALQRIMKFVRLPIREKHLMVEAFVLLLHYSFLIHVMPFRWWETRIGRKMQPLQQKQLTFEQKRKIGRIRLTVFRANMVLLEGAKCFAISLTLKKMLQKRKIASTLFLGVRKNEPEKLLAHAWLTCGDITIYGGREAAFQYRELVAFT